VRRGGSAKRGLRVGQGDMRDDGGMPGFREWAKVVIRGSFGE